MSQKVSAFEDLDFMSQLVDEGLLGGVFLIIDEKDVHGIQDKKSGHKSASNCKAIP